MKTLKNLFESWIEARSAYIKARFERGFFIY